MSQARMVAVLLGIGLAVPQSAMAPAQTGSSAVTTTPEPAARGAPAADLAPGEPEEVRGGVFSVERVDRSNRSLVVRGPDGSLTTVRIAPTAAGFEEVATGDRIALDYYQSSLISLGSPRPAIAAADQTPTRANSPVLGAAGGRQITSKARVTDVDNQTGTLQILTADGRPHTFVTGDPAIRDRLSSLRDGDEMTVTYTEAVAVGLHTATGS